MTTAIPDDVTFFVEKEVARRNLRNLRNLRHLSPTHIQKKARAPWSALASFMELCPFYARLWQTVMAATPAMSSAEQPRDRSLTGFATPWRMGP